MAAAPRHAFALLAIAMSVNVAAAPLAKEVRPKVSFLSLGADEDASTHHLRGNAGVPTPPTGTLLLAMGLVLSVLGNLAQALTGGGGTGSRKQQARIRGLQVSLMLQRMKASKDKSEVDELKTQLSREDVLKNEDDKLMAELKAALAQEEGHLASEKKRIEGEEKKFATEQRELVNAQHTAQSARDSNKSAEIKKRQDEVKKRLVELQRQSEDITKQQKDLQRSKEIRQMQQQELVKQQELCGKLEAEERRLVTHEAKLAVKESHLSADSEKDRQTMAELQKQHALIRRQQEQLKKEREVSLKKQEELKQQKELSAMQRERLKGLDADRTQKIESILRRGNVHVDMSTQQIKILKALPFKPTVVTKNMKVAPPASFEDPALADKVLSDLAQLLSYLRRTVLLVEGHTGGGTLAVSDVGFQIATERAELVVQTLVAKGVSPARLEYRGFPGTMGDNEFTTKITTISWGYN